MAKYLDETGLGTLWGRIDNYFLRKSGGNITGSLTISDNAVLHAGNYNSSTYADTIPTLNSTKLITSGGMYSVIEEIEDVVAASENSLNNRVSTLEGMNLVLGTGLTTDKIVLGNSGGNVKTSSKGISTSAPNPSSDDTTIPTSKAVWDALGSMSGALKYKGTIASSGGTVTDLPAAHSVGDVYVVKTAGTYAGKACEVGDYIICNTDGTTANNDHWDVLNGENQVENKSASLAAAGSSATVATIDGTDITVTTPSSWTGLDKVGTITKVGNTTSGDVTVSVTSGGATIGTTATTIATIGGVAVQAKIDSYATPSHNNHYIGTTQVQNSSAQQNLTGIGASTFNGVMNLTGSSTSYCQGIRIHDVSSTSSIWFKAQAESGFDAGMIGISGKSTGLAFRLPATASGTTPNDYLTIAYGGEIATTNITTATTASGKNMAFRENRTGGAQISMGVGSGNVNHGVYSHSLDKWLIKADSTDTTDKKVYVNETFVPYNSGTVWTTDGCLRFADFFGTSTSTASTKDKTTTTTSKSVAAADLVDGYCAIIRHTNSSSVSNPTLNVGGSGAKNIYTKSGTRITGSTGVWAAGDIVGWTYDTSLNSGNGGWRLNSVLGNGTDHRLRVLIDRDPLYTYTETDPVYSASAASGISTTDISNWNTAYGWGNPSGTYLPLAGGQMTGAINTAPSTSANDTSKGLNFTGSNSATGHIGMSSLLGIYSSGNIVLRPNGGSNSGAGLELTGTSIVFNGKAVLTSDRDVRFADFFGESETGAGTAAKVTINNSKALASADLVPGLSAVIYHKNSSTVSNPTLNVGGAGGKKMYTTGGTRITGSTGVWAAGDIVRWVYDATLDSNSGGWVKADVIANGESHRYRLLTGGTTIPAGIKIATRSNTTTDTLQDTSGNDITYSPSSGITSINAVPLYRQDADWGDWVFCWERNNGYGKTGMMYKSGSSTTSEIGELGVAGITHFYSTVTMAASNSYTPGTVNTGRMAVAFQGTAASTPGTDGCSFYIQCKAYDSTDSWKNFAIFRFNENGIYKYFDANCPNSNYAGQAYWVLDESMALSNSEIDSILAAVASS